MKAIRIHSYGHSDQIHVEEAPRPSPDPGEVLVRIRAAGVNPVDWKIREGYMKDEGHDPFPLTLGRDFAGEIVEVGEGVRHYKVGDEVFGFADGSYAEYAKASIGLIAHKPSTLDFAAAAALPVAGLTAYQIITRVVRPNRGQVLLIHGAAGGVGALVCQLAKWQSARVIASASIRDAVYLRQLGVDQIIDYKSERFEEKAKDVDAVIDLVGGDTLSRSYSVIKFLGTLVTAVGPLDAVRAQEQGIRAVQFVMEPNQADLVQVARLADQGTLRPRVSQVIELTRAREAQDLNQSGASHGKVILRVA
ncbi:NADP-dependent oxidoreductase [Tardiphaga sp.]|uniref:NADP-dependent oxidoreductase n=1 Tax=Tardiphaga sp. TaxID=1926292 RepID=UPI0026379CC0|nr:NADP-dependent oxidoreductase [Tardiphaga sp.]MDB5621316.1 hypothetical protein [Tardiphaga sp.]